jgi:hypothetical protein
MSSNCPITMCRHNQKLTTTWVDREQAYPSSEAAMVSQADRYWYFRGPG